MPLAGEFGGEQRALQFGVRGQDVQADRKILVSRINDHDVGHTGLRHASEDFVDEIPVGIDHHKPATGLHVRANQVGQERGLASAGFSKHPHMPEAVGLLHPNQGSSAVIDILAQHTYVRMVS